MENLQSSSGKVKGSNVNKNAEISEFIEDIKQQAEELVLNEFPRRVLELDSLIKREDFKADALSAEYNDLNATEPVAENPDIEEFTDEYQVQAIPNRSPITTQLMKFHVNQLLEDTQLLKMWIQFLTPRREDVSDLMKNIIGDLVSEAQKIETKAEAILLQIPTYFISRGETQKKSTECYFNNNFPRAVKEIDESFYCRCRLTLIEFRSYYAVLYDMISKNLKELKSSPSLDFPEAN